MTGYGSAESQFDGVVYAVEIKTVNNRHFKSKIKLPDSIAFLEENIEKLLRENLSRGVVSYTLWLKDISADVLFSIDEKALKMYIKKLSEVASSVSVDCPIEIGSLLNLPGIVQPAIPDKESAKTVTKAALDVTQKALEQLKKMRAVEGEVLQCELKKHCDAIKEDLDKINARRQITLKDYHRNFQKRVDELLAKVKLKLDEETLAREVAVFVEKSDISEEIARLESHLRQFDDSCKQAGQAGRRMEFISQEMLREANTIASKAADTEIVNWVVDMKCQIDRIKEQVQNIE
jgi:uncharacterized protein (TIGR00255 family)